jgi:phosphonate transport system permease protein
LGVLALGLLLVWASQTTQVDLDRLLDAEGRRNAADLLSGLSEPDHSDDFLERVWKLTLESVAIGMLGVALALVLGVPLALLGARTPELRDAPGRSLWWERLGMIRRWCARSVLAVLRSIPEIVWAFLFVRILGLGPGPAVLAIGLTFAGIIGKLYSELMEACDPRPVRALRAAGATRLGALFFGVLPQVRAQWVGYGLFRLECSLRSAAILGVVGAGGIGSEIELSIRYFQYDKLATALLAVLACVVLLEFLSVFLRRAHARWSLALLGVGCWLGLGELNIPWSELWDDAAMKQGGIFLASLLEPTTDSDFLGGVWTLVLETLAMALVGTVGAALLAFLLAPLATRMLTVRGFLESPPRVAWWWTAPRWLVLASARLVLQVTRALPELVWAMLFVLWVGPGPFAGALAVGAHTIGILGRLFGEVYEEVEPEPVRALEAAGAGATARWAYGVLPQVAPRLAAYVLFRFEVNVRATATVGFVGAGGIGNAIHTAVSLFHMADLAALLLVLLATVLSIDALGDRVRRRLILPSEDRERA